MVEREKKQIIKKIFVVVIRFILWLFGKGKEG